MDIERIKEIRLKQDGLSNTLGMEFISTPEPDTLIGRMKVDKLNRQVFGFLSGGASLALAENVAGVASMALCPERISVGINVSGSHVRAVREGDVVTAYAKLKHKGRTIHEWQVDIKNGKDELVSTVHVTNYVVQASQKQGLEKGLMND